MSPPVPQLLGRYVLLRKIGEGDVAESFRAKIHAASEVERDLVIKRVRPFYANDEKFTASYIAESEAASQLNHRNIARVFEAGTAADDLYLAMEYVPGSSLAEIDKRTTKAGKRLTPPLVARIVSEAASALHAAHTNRRRGKVAPVLHRDLGPHNVLVSYDGNIKLTDFGISTARKHITQTQAGMSRGKCDYLSPEQIAGKTVDGRSDIFSLGVLAWELMTGKRLFAGATDFETIRNVMNMEIHPLRSMVRNIPKSLDAVLMRALARDVEERFASAGELNRELEKQLAEIGEPASSESLAWYLREFFRNEQALLTSEINEEREAFMAFVEGRPHPFGDMQMDEESTGTRQKILENVAAATQTHVSAPAPAAPESDVGPPEDSALITRPWSAKKALGIDEAMGQATGIFEAVNPNDVTKILDTESLQSGADRHATKEMAATKSRSAESDYNVDPGASAPNTPEEIQDSGGRTIVVLIGIALLAAIAVVVYLLVFN